MVFIDQGNNQWYYSELEEGLDLCCDECACL